MEMKAFCRTCMQEIKDPNCLVLQNWEKIKFELFFCVPELEIDLVVKPTLCLSCLNALHLCYNFKNLCLANEQRIYNNLQSLNISSNTLTLAEVLSGIDTRSNKIILEQTTGNIPKTFESVLEEQTGSLVVECIPEKQTVSVVNDDEDLEELIEQHPIIKERYHANIISNLEAVVTDPIQFVELSDEQLISETSLQADKHVEIENMDIQPVLEYPIMNDSTNAALKQQIINNIADVNPKLQIRFNLLQKRKTKYTCDLCGFSTAINEHFLIHKRDVHCDVSNPRSQSGFLCVLCANNFISKDVLANHMNVKHNVDKLVFCLQCDYICHDQQYFINHMKEHVEAQEADVIMID